MIEIKSTEKNTKPENFSILFAVKTEESDFVFRNLVHEIGALTVCLPVRPPIRPSVCLPVCLTVCL